jgi:peroxiredoxin
MTIEQALRDSYGRADALSGPLDVCLESYLARSRKILPKLEAAYDQLIARIVANEITAKVPGVGDKLPDFVMTDSDGHLVDLASLLERGPLVISFNRGPWCDYCGLELQALARAYPKILLAGGDIVSIIPGTPQYASDLRERWNVPFAVLTDLDLAYTLSLGLAYWVGDKVKGMYLQLGIDLARFQGSGGWMLPLPATFIVGKDGLIEARCVDSDFRRRMRIEHIVDAVKAYRWR